MGHVIGHFFRRDADPGTALLEGAEQISPEGDQIVLLLGHHPLAFHAGGASQAVPESLVAVAGMLTLDHPAAKALGVGSPSMLRRPEAQSNLPVCTAEMP